MSIWLIERLIANALGLSCRPGEDGFVVVHHYQNERRGAPALCRAFQTERTCGMLGAEADSATKTSSGEAPLPMASPTMLKGLRSIVAPIAPFCCVATLWLPTIAALGQICRPLLTRTFSNRICRFDAAHEN